MKKLFSLFTVIMMAVMSLNLNAITVAAEDPTTYFLKYNAEKKDWFYQEGAWDEESDGREMYYMTLEVQNGDYVVVVPSADYGELKLDFTVGNLTVMPNASVTVYANSIKDCYVCKDSFAIINTNVENAWIYENATANFNNDVNYVESYYEGELNITLGVGGKCGRLFVHTDGHTKYDYYSLTGPFVIDKDEFSTDGSYSTTPTAPTPAPAAPAAPSTPSTGTSADEYDDVPKTGASSAYLWAFGLAALCFAGSYSLKKRA